jgi:hypothetical protein
MPGDLGDNLQEMERYRISQLGIYLVTKRRMEKSWPSWVSLGQALTT